MVVETGHGRRDSPATGRGATFAIVGAAAVAAAGMLARDSDAAPALPVFLVALSQAPLLVVWARRIVIAREWATVAIFSLFVLGCGFVGIRRDSADAAVVGISLFLFGHLTLDYLRQAFRQIEDAIATPMRLLRVIAGPWLVAVVVSAALLALPIGTQPGVPDYRHNLLSHVASCLHAAVSTGCLVGTMTFDFGSELSHFGQIVLFLLTQVAGFAFAAMGLALVAPLLKRPPSLRRVYLVIVGLQLSGAAALWTAWRPEDVASSGARAWWSMLHSGSALWNTGLMMRPDGLAAYFQSSRVFLSITTLAIAGSLGIPVLIVLMRAKDESPAPGRSGRFEGTATSDAMLAFLLLAFASAAIWYCEHPASRLGDWRPARPFEPSGNRQALVDLPDGRWAMSVLVAATVRSAGFQSIPLSTGTVTWATYGLLLALMFVGGGVAGTGGGLRTTFFGVVWAGRSRRSTILRRLLTGLFVWLGANAVAVIALGFTTNAATYDTAFEAMAAINNVALSTGLTPHLTTGGRLVLTAIIIFGRFWPLIFWAGTMRRLSHDSNA